VKLKVQDVLNVALFSALTEIGAYICVPLPFSPVPITLQTLFTYMAGALLGGYLGALSQMIYVILAAAYITIRIREMIPIIFKNVTCYLL
jgi:biotin transport system substrate-specific component